MDDINDDLILEELMVSRYSQRFKELGYDVKTLGWGDEEQQTYRFFQTLDSNINLENKNILDIGCGFGDYAAFLNNNNIKYNSYLGIDINPDLINEAKMIFTSSHNVNFKILNLKTNKSKQIADIGVMIGVLNLKHNYNNLQYSKEMITNAFE